MRTTKMRRDVLKRWLANEDYEPSQDDVAELLLDLDEQLENVAAIALAAGLGADATAEEVVARVGEMARTLSLIGTWRHEHGAALKPSRADTYGDGMRGAKQQVGAILSRLAEESGREGAAIVQPVGGCDGSREFAYDGSAEDGRGARLAQRCPGCRACS